ncbi:MAG TPA: dicarboxylate/amino acid:cation symporter [Chitinophaga sp.]|uniref:dicarboxylate/amino acid:cation symporter n=1 Tax=Chitinophaga sp. TaxID=1869181 RepID=UPI002C3E0C13|nr:dicarboxylate/amino acid:cation symporter [Chitinophaga sp.]HVI47048.1 dicarboxylate/amino acid:cation symporter [Chitinophaga sp.]
MKNYAGIVFLLCGIAAGSLLGLYFPLYVPYVKPVGDIFLNLLFTAVIPLVFFAVASVIANLRVSKETGRLITTMTVVFTGTVLLAGLITLLYFQFFPITLSLTTGDIPATGKQPDAGEQIVQMLTVTDFHELFSRKSMLALMIVSFLVGAAARRAGSGGEAFRAFLVSGNLVMRNVIHYIMLLAPAGLGAYFAWQIVAIGPQLAGAYTQILLVSHWISFAYYVIAFSVYAWIAGGVKNIAFYWKYNITPSVTALATCSSIATIPANMEAAGKMGIPSRIADIVIPLGASLHKEGSVIAAVVKVAVALALAHHSIHTWHDASLALLIAILVSVIEGGIPNGGYVGQLLIVSAYHLPAEVLPSIMIIGTLLDPAATLLNATGDTVAAMLVRRFTGRE